MFNGVSSRFEVTGTVDPAMLNGRTVRSSDVVGFRLVVSGTKEGLGMAIGRWRIRWDAGEVDDARALECFYSGLTNFPRRLSR